MESRGYAGCYQDVAFVEMRDGFWNNLQVGFPAYMVMYLADVLIHWLSHLLYVVIVVHPFFTFPLGKSSSL